MLFPAVCFEIAICNETLPRLLGDLGRYFQAGTGTQHVLAKTPTLRYVLNLPLRKDWLQDMIIQRACDYARLV